MKMWIMLVEGSWCLLEPTKERVQEQSVLFNSVDKSFFMSLLGEFSDTCWELQLLFNLISGQQADDRMHTGLRQPRPQNQTRL